jgi:microcystin degradation protein MlrC
MKIVAATIAHETNTFSPIPTRLQDFFDTGPLYGAEALAFVRGSGRSMAGMIAAADAAGADVHMAVAGSANPARAVDEGAFETMVSALCKAVRAGCDAVFLEMHGAMVTTHLDDGEGEILARIRAIAPGMPIAVALDLHGNLSRRTIENCTTLVGYRTYPHIDIVETGRRAAEALLSALRGETRPVLAYAHTGMMPNMLRMATDSGAMAEMMAMAKQAEDEGALAVSVFGGFPLADSRFTGMSIVAMTDNDPAGAQAICDRLSDFAWRRREDFRVGFEPLEATMARAATLTTGPVILVDHADNCNSGGTQDSMDVIAAALRHGLDGIAAGPIADAEAVAAMVAAGVGAEVELAIGGKTDFTAIGGSCGPLTLRGTVRTISDGRFTVRGPVFTGSKVALGRTVVLDTGHMKLVVSEDRCEPLDLAMFRFVGIEPTEQRYVIIKSKIQYRPTFGAIASHVLDCNGVGFASLDHTKFRFERITRPLYPIDA